MIVDNYVEPSEMLYCVGDHRVARCGVAHVADRYFTSPARLANLVAGGLEMLGVAAGDQDRSAAQGEFLRDRSADSGAAAGNDRNFIFDTERIFQILASGW